LPDAFIRGVLVGLKEELAAYFTRQLDTIRSLDFETCPGETYCSENGVIFLARREEPDRPIEQICAGCRLRDTKPGSEPAHLTLAIQTATDLDGLKSAGGTFAYPDSLSAFEWVCITALQFGRGESEARAMEERQSEVNRDSEKARLEQLRRR
jgi:hypothetical protein